MHECKVSLDQMSKYIRHYFHLVHCICTGAVTTDSNFTSPPPVCPGTNVTFTCSVADPGNPPGLRSTIWTIESNPNQCGLSHPVAPTRIPCASLFIATLGLPQGVCYTSNLTATVNDDYNGLSVLCYAFAAQPQFLVGNATLQVIGQCFHCENKNMFRGGHDSGIH